MSEEFVGIVKVLWSGSARLFALIELTHDYIRNVERAMRATAAEGVTSVVVAGSDLDLDCANNNRVVLLPDHMWKHIGSVAIEQLNLRAPLVVITSTIMVRFSKEHFDILYSLALPVGELRTVIGDDSVSFELDLSVGDFETMYSEDFTSNEVFEWLNRRGTLDGLNHGANLEVAAESAGAAAPSGSRPPEGDELSCRSCGALVDAADLDNGLCEACGFECQACGTIHLSDELTDYEVCAVCSRTYGQCGECGDIFERCDLIDGECAVCRTSNCGVCGSEVPSADLDDDNRCATCADKYGSCIECGGEFLSEELSVECLCVHCVEAEEA